MQKSLMEKLIELLCVSMEEKYYVELDSGFKCIWREERLDCTCLSCEILNQMLGLLLNFFEEPDFKVKFRMVNNRLLQTVFDNRGDNKEKLYVVATDDEVGQMSFEPESIEHELCRESCDRRPYIKLQNKLFDEYRRQKGKRWIKREVVRLRLEIGQDAQLKASSNRIKNDFAFKIVRRVRVANEEGKTHKFLLAMSLFLASQNTLKLLLEYVKECSDTMQAEKREILQFLCIYTTFLKEMVEEAIPNGMIYMDSWNKLIEKYWGFNFGIIITEINSANEEWRKHYTECLVHVTKENARRKTIKKWRELLQLLGRSAGERMDSEIVEKISHNLDCIVEQINAWKCR